MLNWVMILSRLLDRRLGQDVDHRGGHHIPRLLLRNDPASQEGQEGFFNLNEGLVLDRCRGRLGMASAPEGEGDFSRIHLLDATPCHEIDFVLHLSKGENHAEVLHLHELVHQHGEVADIFLAADLAKDHLNPVDHVGGGRLGEIAEDPHLFGGQLARQHVRNQVGVGSLLGEPSRGSVVVRFVEVNVKEPVSSWMPRHRMVASSGEREIFLSRINSVRIVVVAPTSLITSRSP